MPDPAPYRLPTPVASHAADSGQARGGGEPGQPLRPLAGAACGLAAAVGYTAANSLLRASIDQDPVWVSTLKAVPTMVGTLPFLALLHWQGRPLARNWQSLPLLLLAVLVGQFGGNVAFQVALGIIGLALSVPIALGTMITSGAVLGRLMLGEPVTRRTVASIAILTLAVAVLSLGGKTAGNELRQMRGTAPAAERTLPRDRPAFTPPPADTLGRVLLGGLAAAGSGLAYAFLGTAMRSSFRGGISVPAAMFASGAVGSSALAAAAWWRIGSEGMAATPADQLAVMLGAGIFNLVAFFALSLSLKAIPVVAVNLLNATQAAMAAAAGVMFFGEPLTAWLGAGLLMTVAGLLVLSGRRQPRVGQ